MQLRDYVWQTKSSHRSNRTEYAGRQIVLDFGRYHLSIIDDGYGREDNLLEIGVFSASDGVAGSMTELPGITDNGDTIRGFLTESEVDLILKKLHTITGVTPTQI